jgi:hypothetical protein
VFQGGAVAVLCWAVWYLLARSQPKLQNAILESHKAHIDAQAKARDDFKESLKVVVDAGREERVSRYPTPTSECEKSKIRYLNVFLQ